MDVAKYLVLYSMANIGFALAFYVLFKGTTYATQSDDGGSDCRNTGVNAESPFCQERCLNSRLPSAGASSTLCVPPVSSH